MDNGHIVAIITKSSQSVEIPACLQGYIDDKLDISDLCEALLQYQYTHAFLGRKLKDSFLSGIFNLVQFFAQMLPWSWKMKLKHLIKQA